MTHRALQIIDAAAAVIPQTGQRVFVHRVMSLGEGEQEAPAQSVCMGEDNPLDDDGASNLAFLDSLVRIEVVSLVKEADEEAALAKLMEMRTKTHVAFMADRSLGLTFVIDTRYAGASKPELELNDQMCGRQVTNWDVHYRMNISDPS